MRLLPRRSRRADCEEAYEPGVPLLEIIDEVTSPYFVDKYKTSSMQIGENGDCFLNKEAITILRRIKARKPDMSVLVWTDMQFFTPEKMEIVVRERLLDFVGLNIDGASDHSFAAVKRLSSKYTREHLPIFIELREKYGATIPLTIQSLTMRHYVDAVPHHWRYRARQGSRLARSGRRLRGDQGACDAHAQAPGSLPTVGLDVLGGASPGRTGDPGLQELFLPADVSRHARGVHRSRRHLVCLLLRQQQQLVLGNVYETSVEAVAQGDVRKRLVKLLTERRFDAIGGPCATVNCCQLRISEPLQRMPTAAE